MLGQLLVLAAAAAGIIRSVWPAVAPQTATAAGLLAGPALFGAAAALGMYLVPGPPGVVVGWVTVLGAALGFCRRDRRLLSTLLPGRGRTVLWLVAFMIALSARQQYWIPDAMVHAPLSASLMAGVFPPRFPWSPDVPAIYHFLPELVIGAFNLGLGPGLVLTTELVGAFVAAALAMLVVAVAAEHRAHRLAMALMLPMLLSPGLWTLVLFTERPAAALLAIPVGLPEAGLRAALGSVYVPDLASAATAPIQAAPPNIINPHFIWSYGLAITIALLATAQARHRAAGAAVGALLLSALSAIDETIFVAVLSALGGYAAFSVLRDRHRWRCQIPLLLALVCGSGLALVQGGVLTDLLFHAPPTAEVLGLHSPTAELAWLGEVLAVGGGLGVVSLGTLAVLLLGAGAAYLARSVVLAIVVAMGMALFAGFVLVHFPASPQDIARLEGHALNLGMIALAIGLAVGTARLRNRGVLYGGTLLFAGLVLWPTVADSVGRIAEAVADGPRLYVAGTRPVEHTPSFSTRSQLDAEIADHRSLLEAVSAIVGPDDRILTARPKLISAGTGRPTPLGYAEWPHYVALSGPEYQDAVRFLDGAALRELGIDYVHANATMLGGMSEEARRRLASPTEFRLVHESPAPKTDALYAVVPQSQVSEAPAPLSFRSLAQLAEGRRVLISSATHPLVRLPLYYTLRTNEHLYGRWDDPAHFRRDVRIHPPTGATVDLIALPDSLYPSPLDPVHRIPVWSAERVQVFDLTSKVSGQAAPPPIRVAGRSLLDPSGIQITSRPRWPESWTGTDWVLYREVEPGTGIPAILEPGRRWFPGLLAPQHPEQRIAVRFNAARGQLEQRSGNDGWIGLGESAGTLPPDAHVLTLRFSAQGEPVFFVPIAVIALDGEQPHDRVFELDGA